MALAARQLAPMTELGGGSYDGGLLRAPSIEVENLVSFTPAANTTYYCLVVARQPFIVGEIAWVPLTAGGASTDINVSIYSFDPAVFDPNSRLVTKSLTARDLSATTDAQIQSFDAAYELNPGYYYAAWSRSNATGAIIGIDFLSTLYANIGRSNGYETPAVVGSEAAFAHSSTATAAVGSTAPVIVPALVLGNDL